MTIDLGISEEQGWRAGTYNLLAKLLQAPPDKNVLESLRDICPEDSDFTGKPIAQAWKHLSIAARQAEPESIRTEYHRLFIGMTRGEILPYASWYLTGFLMEKPLAQLRNDLLDIGIARYDQVREPEDHIGALFEVMTLLIRGKDERQHMFFERHISTWAPRLFRDIANTRDAVFYRSVANLAAGFIDLEQTLFELPDCF